MPWQPTIILRPEKVLATATETVRVTTDVGPGYLKALGNKGGPHYLAADWIGTRLAGWLGLPTFEFAIIEVTPEDEIQFKAGRAQPGPAFITREHGGWQWGGTVEELRALVNPQDIGKLVFFDTWTRNCDRYPPDAEVRKPNRGNVFLSSEGMEDGQLQLLAMDHTHCFNCGRDLNARLGDVDLVMDDRLYGLFPEFKPFIQPHWQALTGAVKRLEELDKTWLEAIIGTIPALWEVGASARMALATLVLDRAHYMSRTFIPLLETQLG
jgi:hypothetical protein